MKPFTEEERYNYDLTPDSIVIDAGAYHGQFSRKLWEKYKCRIFAFEPINDFFQIAQQTLSGTDVSLIKAGLGAAPGFEWFGVANDSTGKFKNDAPKQLAMMIGAPSFLSSLPSCVDLLKLNIEGGEFMVLEALIEGNLIASANNIQVQFHRCFPDSDLAVQNLSERLSRTHHLTYDAGAFIWQNWEINK